MIALTFVRRRVQVGLLLAVAVLMGLIVFQGRQTRGAQSPARDASAAIGTPDTAQRPQPNFSRANSLKLLGGESSNPRAYDPATGGNNTLLYSGLVTFNEQLKISPDLADTWLISPDGTIYTFHIRSNARFHNGRAVTAQDVAYSWERAADPATNSDEVLTYLGDIVGIADKHTGKAKSISGLKAVDDHTLQVTIDAPKPYFLMKLTYGVAAVVDKANIESGADWYRTPNGTGPYKLVYWQPAKLIVYESNADFYLPPPAIRYIVLQLYAGVGSRLYETGKIDVTGVASFDVQRYLNPAEPMHKDLLQGVSMCTSDVLFDVTQPPFDDAKVRQAFALATNQQQYVDLVLSGVGIPAHGLYPPALPGYNATLTGLPFDPKLARQRLAESKYGSADKMPPIVYTRSGYGSSEPLSTSALIDMWQTTLGVTIQVQNIDPEKYSDEIRRGHHGQMLLSGWCADYPDPENFADALFHTGAQANLGHYSNPALDTLLDQGRTEQDSARRLQDYQQAENLIVDNAAAIFLNHSLSYVLVKPYIKGYSLTPFVPIYRYLSIDASRLPK